MHGPRKSGGENSPGRGNEEQDAQSARYREAAVNGENRRDPWHRRQDEKKTVKKSARKRHARPCAKQRKEENPDTNPGIDIEIETGIGGRKLCAGRRTDEEAQRRRYSRTALRKKSGEPTAARHQSFTMALKPRPSRPFLATSAAL